jgi:hypothetical protein
LVIAVQKLKPCGTAVAGMLLPRLKLPLEFVPRVVSTQSDGWLRFCCGGAPAIRMSSTQPPNEPGPLGLS